ncbi:unnamed protein product [Miscanthus lutarioriparius]|uniref:Uncharacterized protein n=1 Tax=Miscanthus lutarioriparius TaxID=422564 RepID=A0A811MDG0_9POAL|nr:unnamed protein product [Miscanthus lutarioriparius]CAD6203247.1 unnamed protein product [Miscanthus lutarioriparius]
MASKIGATMSGTNGGSGGEVSATKEYLLSCLRGQLDQKMFASLQCILLIDRLIRVGAMETEEVKDQDVAGEQAGILSAMATKIGMAMSGANGDDSRGDSGHDDAKTSNGEAVRGNNGEEKKGEEANGGGILSAVASKIGVAVSGANGNGNLRMMPRRAPATLVMVVARARRRGVM